ncbi:MAG: ATP-binding protein [Planctomycetota bacterium]
MSVAIFDDRLEVWSAGTLPDEIRVQDLKRQHLSKPRNDLIAKTFYRAGLIEKWGRGTQKIVELCVAAGHPEPHFAETAGFVCVTFFAAGYSPPLRVGQNLSELQREALALLSRSDSLAVREVQEQLAAEVSSRTLKRTMTQLVEMKLIEPLGQGRARRYRLVE